MSIGVKCPPIIRMYGGLALRLGVYVYPANKFILILVIGAGTVCPE